MTDVAKYPPPATSGQGSDNVPAPRGYGNTASWLPGLDGLPRVETAREQGRPEIDPGIIIAGFQRDRPARVCDAAFNVPDLGVPGMLAGVACWLAIRQVERK
jgi:hypothetical protein